MRNNKFQINTLPDIQDIINSSANKMLRDDAREILNVSLHNSLSKPTIYHNLIFYVEISIKYYLIVMSELNVEKVENYGHDIYRLIEVSKQYNASFEKLRFLLDKIKDRNNKKVNLSKYYNYKYNKEIGEMPLIFDLEINGNERKIVKEVIEWLSSHI